MLNLKLCFFCLWENTFQIKDFPILEIFFQSQFNSNLEQTKSENKKLTDQIDKLREENRHLKEEYEKYKIRTNYLIKSAKYQTSKEPVANQETEQQLRQTLKKHKEEIDILNKRIQLASRERTDEIQKLNEQFEQQEISMRNGFKVQLDKLEHERLESIQELEKELVKQRERTIKLLNEREEELGVLKGNHQLKAISPIGKSGMTRSSSENAHLKDLSRASSSNSVDLSDKSLGNERSKKGDSEILLAKRSNEFLSPEAHNRIIHYSQEAAYRDMELNRLRTHKVCFYLFYLFIYLIVYFCSFHSVSLIFIIRDR